VLWELLCDCRRQFAEEQGVPPYIIFNDRTLQEMCFRQPQTLAEFADINGVGARKQEKYNAAFLDVIRRAAGSVR